MGRPDFIELPVGDIAAAQTFYEQVFGRAMTGFGPTYACTLTGDVDIGLQADRAEQCAAPLVVIQVPDLDAACDAVRAAGGTVTREIFAFPGGRRSIFAIRRATSWRRTSLMPGTDLTRHKPDQGKSSPWT